MTTEQLERAALTEICPVHMVPPGARCPIRPSGAAGDACLDRRALADAGNWLDEFPGGETLAGLSPAEALTLLLRGRQDARDLAEIFNRARLATLTLEDALAVLIQAREALEALYGVFPLLVPDLARVILAGAGEEAAGAVEA
jgi:hypothetical protein